MKPVLVVATVLVLGVIAPSAAAREGALVQKPLGAGCVSETGSGGQCADGVALQAPAETALSPDGLHLYVSAYLSDSIAVFDRNVSTGALTQKAGTAGCVSESGTGGQCSVGRGIDFLDGLAVSPDGKNLYAAGQASDAVAVFDIDQATGALTQKAGTAGCVSETGSGGSCADGTALDGADGIAVSADGTSVYVASYESDAVAIFDRAVGGALTQKPGTAGCISESGTGGSCQDGRGLDGPYPGILAAGDGESVYVPSLLGDAIAVLDRAPDGSLSQSAGASGCVQDTGADGCADGVALGRPNFLVETPDGAHVYSANGTGDSVAVFDRAGSGAITQKPGTAGCVSDDGSAGQCQDGVALDDVLGLGISPDGATLYAAASVPDSIAVFDIDPGTGALRQLPGVEGCLAASGLGGQCTPATGIAGTRGRISVSAGGGFVYGAGSEDDAVTTFERTPNLRPFCSTASVATAFAVPVAVPLSCTDPDDDPITRAVVTQPAHGTLGAVDPAGTVLYTPGAGTSGPDSFTFEASDAGGPGTAVTASVLVQAPIPAPPPAPAPAPSPTPTQPQPRAPAAVAITSIATLPSAKACVSRRRFSIRLKAVKANRIVRAQIRLNGSQVRQVTGNALRLPIDLRGLPKGRFTVEIVTTDSTGKKLVGRRVYRTCVAKKR
jgi:6-phosphogluconolactonase (cycloisomerase 2 family)